MSGLLKKLIYRFAGIDESGDLTMSLKSSSYFVLSCFMHDDENFERRFRKFIGKLNHKKNKKKINILHARLDNDNIKLKTLRFLKQIDFKVLLFLQKKNKSSESEVDYHFILKKLVSRIESGEIKVSSPRANEEFRKKILGLDERISLSNPQESPSIQLADLFAWAIFKSLEHNDDTYFTLVKDKVELVEIKI